MNTRYFIFGFLCLMGGVVAYAQPNLIPYRKGNKWGFCDKTVIECKQSSLKKISKFLLFRGIIACKFARIRLAPNLGKIV